jgi:predicted enzyme related to lactoylglutathione lyase
VTGVGRLGYVQIDCVDPQRLGQFWAALLGTGVQVTYGEPPHYVNLTPVDGGPSLSLHRVARPTPGKNRLHVDLVVDDLEQATQRVQAFGGGTVPDGDISEYGFNWRVMSDPEGNQFCLIAEQPVGAPARRSDPR